MSAAMDERDDRRFDVCARCHTTKWLQDGLNWCDRCMVASGLWNDLWLDPSVSSTEKP